MQSFDPHCMYIGGMRHLWERGQEPWASSWGSRLVPWINIILKLLIEIKKDPRIVYTNFGPKIKTQNDVKWPKKIGTWKFCIGTWNPKDRDIEKKDRDMRFSAPLVQGTSLYKGFWKILAGLEPRMGPRVCRRYVGRMSDTWTLGLTSVPGLEPRMGPWAVNGAFV